MILALDTLTPRTAIFANGHNHVYDSSPDQAGALIDQIIMCLADARPSHIIVLTGPGSFTGLRVGLAAAHGLGQAFDVPVIGVDVMHAFAMLLPQETAHYVLIDSRRKDVALAHRGAGESSFSPLVEMPPHEAHDLIARAPAPVSGNGAVMLPDSDLLDIAAPWIDLALLVGLMEQDIASVKGGYQAINTAPVYLRPPDVTISPNKFEHKTLYKS